MDTTTGGISSERYSSGLNHESYNSDDWPLLAAARKKNGRRSWSSWPSAASHSFLDNLQGGRDVKRLQGQLQQLDEGTSIPCRGRDSMDDDWDYGYCTKQSDDCLYFQYASGDHECFLIRGINFVHLVHLAIVVAKTMSSPSTMEQQKSSTDYDVAAAAAAAAAAADGAKKQPQPIVLLAHGWSPHVGPHYPLIQNLAACARRKGCRVIVPDFRSTYAHGERRARAERVKQIYEELLVVLTEKQQQQQSSTLSPPPFGSTPPPAATRTNNTAPLIIMVGHSQGGAAVACACTPKLCSRPKNSSNLDIRGVVMLGTEDPTSHDSMNWIPPIPHVGMVHAVLDDTIDVHSIRNLAQKWNCPLTELSSQTSLPKGARDVYGDDMHHDFLIPDLMDGARTAFDEFLEKCLHG